MVEDDALRIRLQSEFSSPNVVNIQSVQVKRGPRAWKTASLLRLGNRATGEITGTRLVVQTWTRATDYGSYRFEEKAQYRWYCEDEEVNAIRDMLTAQLPRDGVFTVVEDDSPAAIVARLTTGGAEDAVELVSELLAIPTVRDALSGSDAVTAGTALVDRIRKIRSLDRLEKVALDPSSSEGDLQRSLDRQWWLFGGRYIGQHERRSFNALDQLDLPLIRADGSLHVVELKKAHVPALIKSHRNHLIVGPEVHEATSQAMNYLRALDESSALISQDFGFDVRRADATVVIGHSAHLMHTRSAGDISQTLRTQWN